MPANQKAAVEEPLAESDESFDLGESLRPILEFVENLLGRPRSEEDGTIPMTVLSDSFHTTYEVPQIIRGKTQLTLLAEFDGVILRRISAEQASLLQEAVDGSPGVEDLLAAAVSIARDPEVGAALCRSFIAAYPDVVKAAVEKASQYGPAPTLNADGELDDPTDVLWVFPVEEVVSGLVPFFGRPVVKILRMLMGIQPQEVRTAA